MATGLVIDTEVNSLEAMEVVSLAWCPVYDGVLEDYELIEIRAYKPEQPFEAGAVAMHGILPVDVADCPPSSGAADDLPATDYLIGHNVDFDAKALGIVSTKRICTLALSRYLWPQFKSHKLAALTLELHGMTDETIRWIKGAHTASTDVQLTCHLLDAIVVAAGNPSLDDLYKLSEIARVPTVMPFGKHKGEPIAAVPSSYKSWLLGQPDVDPYLRKALVGV